jgi:hypothetical protein
MDTNELMKNRSTSLRKFSLIASDAFSALAVRVSLIKSQAIHLLPSMSAVPYNKSESMKRNHSIHTSQETLCKFAQSVLLLVRPIASALDHLI